MSTIKRFEGMPECRINARYVVALVDPQRYDSVRSQKVVGGRRVRYLSPIWLSQTSYLHEEEALTQVTSLVEAVADVDREVEIWLARPGKDKWELKWLSPRIERDDVDDEGFDIEEWE